VVDIEKQQRFDIIIPKKEITSKDCPFVFYPINIYGCNHPSNRKGGDYKECNSKICPFIKSKGGKLN